MHSLSCFWTVIYIDCSCQVDAGSQSVEDYTYLSVIFGLGCVWEAGKGEFLKRFYFMCICVLLHVCVHACWCQWRLSDLLELILQVLLNCQMWMLWTKFGSFVGIGRIHNHRALSLCPGKRVFINVSDQRKTCKQTNKGLLIQNLTPAKK